MLFTMLKMVYAVGSAWGRVKKWYYRNRPPPPMDIGDIDPLSEQHGKHNITFVSRHDIAESGLKCPNCRKQAALRGDFQDVRNTRLGEAIVCRNEQCGSILVASPDTEHGDDQLPYNKKEFHKFVRILPDKALQEEWGEDLSYTDRGEVRTSIKSLKEGKPSPTDDAISWDEVAHKEET